MQSFQRIVVLAMFIWVAPAGVCQTNPTLIATIPPGSPFSWGIQALAASGNWLYVCEDNRGSSDPGLRIFDVSNPASPVEVYRGCSPGCSGVEVIGDRAYVLDGGLEIFDVSNPRQPRQLGRIAVNNAITAVVYDHFVYLDGVAYDISNPAAPVVVGTCPMGAPMAFGGNYGYAAYNFGLGVLDVSDPVHPTVAAYRSTMMAFDVGVSGSYAYLATSTNCGVTVFDISCPTNPVVASCFQTSGYRLTVSGNYLYVLGGQFPVILDASDPTALKLVGTFPEVPALQTDVVVANNVAYISYFEGVSVFSLGEIQPPRLRVRGEGVGLLSLSWPAPSPAFAVQEAASPDAAVWEPLPLTASVRGSENYLEIPRTNGTKFYRLVLQ